MGFSIIELIVAMTAGIVLTLITLPGLYQTAQAYKASGAARGLATQLALTKTRATAGFTQARLNVNAGAGSYTVEVWNKSLMPAAFATEGGTQYLPAGSAMGYGSITTAPPNSQTTIGQTALILFNSRGIPVDGTGAPTSTDALYVSDKSGRYFYALTVSASSKVTIWRRDIRTSTWIKQ